MQIYLFGAQISMNAHVLQAWLWQRWVQMQSGATDPNLDLWTNNNHSNFMNENVQLHGLAFILLGFELTISGKHDKKIFMCAWHANS